VSLVTVSSAKSAGRVAEGDTLRIPYNSIIAIAWNTMEADSFEIGIDEQRYETIKNVYIKPSEPDTSFAFSRLRGALGVHSLRLAAFLDGMKSKYSAAVFIDIMLAPPIIYYIGFTDSLGFTQPQE
jgi:hypothetical protein